MPDYTFDLVNAVDLSKIDELKARNKSLTRTLNKAGSFSFEIHLDDEFSDMVEEIAVGICVRSGSDWRWSGPVFNTNAATPNSLNISCPGWLQTIDKRLTHPNWGHPLKYSLEDAGDIAIDLLTKTNAESIYPDTNFVLPGSIETTQPRTISYEAWTGILSSIEYLSDIESGFDFALDPQTRLLNIYKRIGTVQDEIEFEFGAKAAGITRLSDASRMVNRFFAYSSIGWVQADNLVSQAHYGLIEEAQSLGDVKDKSILQAYANEEIAIRSDPLRFWGFEPRKYASAFGINEPRAFEDFDVGDTVFIKSNKKGLSTNGRQAVRVFSYTINWDDNTGQEYLTSLQTIASGS